MKVLVTGHRGYIGDDHGAMLMNAGHEVQGLDSDFYEQCTFGEEIQNIPHVRKDIRDVDLQWLENKTLPSSPSSCLAMQSIR